jgi:hypothetical protein
MPSQVALLSQTPATDQVKKKPKSTSLLDLPPELRIIVYWLATETQSDVDADPERCTLEIPGFDLTAWEWKIDAGNGSCHLVLKEIPDWIFPNRQFAQEAVPVWVANKVFSDKHAHQ